eukprot:GHRQ01038454.1.p1 GENE.GHRQ01038454.1~~GHRQ01038454.1.p1  ORF type:complete len:160 (+),score=52.09 GHRQ01038454.1:540-1019(+)
MFMDMDRDGSGTISYAELKEGLRRKGAAVADHELERIMAQVDLDGNHTLDFQEFLTATVFMGKLQRRENLMAAFQHFDTDGSGFISEEELLQALQKEGVSAAAIQSLLSEVDRDNDCNVDYDEVCEKNKQPKCMTSSVQINIWLKLDELSSDQHLATLW